MLSLTRGELGGTKCARVKAGVTVRRVIVKIEVTLVRDRYATTYICHNFTLSLSRLKSGHITL